MTCHEQWLGSRPSYRLLRNIKILPSLHRFGIQLAKPTKNKIKDEEADGLPLCRMEYDPTYGARLLPDEEHIEPGIEIY